MLEVRQEHPIPGGVLSPGLLRELLPGLDEDLVLVANVRVVLVQNDYRVPRMPLRVVAEDEVDDTVLEAPLADQGLVRGIIGERYELLRPSELTCDPPDPVLHLLCLQGLLGQIRLGPLSFDLSEDREDQLEPVQGVEPGGPEHLVFHDIPESLVLEEIEPTVSLLVLTVE